MDDLASLQRRFFALITAREEISSAVTRFGLDETDVAVMVRGDARLGPVGRLGIYNDMYFFRLLGVLEEDFPRLATALGDDDFRALVADYLEAVEPRDHALRNLGAALPRFLSEHEAASVRPWLIDLAGLEWAEADVLDRADAAPLTMTDLRDLSPEAFAALPLTAVPAACFIDVGHADFEIAAVPGGSSLAPRPTPARFLVWRVGSGAQHRVVDAVEAAVLPRLFAPPPVTFAEICEVVGQGHSVEEAAPVALGLLAGWVQIGLVRRP